MKLSPLFEFGALSAVAAVLVTAQTAPTSTVNLVQLYLDVEHTETTYRVSFTDEYGDVFNSDSYDVSLLCNIPLSGGWTFDGVVDGYAKMFNNDIGYSGQCQWIPTDEGVALGGLYEFCNTHPTLKPVDSQPVGPDGCTASRL